MSDKRNKYIKNQISPQKQRIQSNIKKNTIKKSMTTSSIEKISPTKISTTKNNSIQNREAKQTQQDKKNNENPENHINEDENQTNEIPEIFKNDDGKQVDSNFVKQNYKNLLKPYEIDEIDFYPDVYFIGNSIKKKNSTENDFDDENTYQYNGRVGDHLAYRYEIVSILGNGKNSTVFKCIDHKTKEKVAIKVLKNTPLIHKQGLIEVENMKLFLPTTNSEQRTQQQQTKLRRISSSGNSYFNNTQINEINTNSNCKHVVKMIDNFIFRNHICIVMEILGESLYDIMKRRTKSTPIHLQKQLENDQELEPLPAHMVKLIAYQIMAGLSTIHRKKIVHGNLQPENILLTNPQESSNDKKNESISNENATDNSIKDSYSFAVDYQRPQKITSHFTVSFTEIDNYTFISQIKIIDFSSCFKIGGNILNTIQNNFYKAPEVVLNSSSGTAVDIWAAGCIIAELFVGKPLFPANNDTDLLFMIIETLGNPPQNVLQMQNDSIKNSKKAITQKVKFFDDNGKLLNVKKQPVPMKTRLTSFLRSSDTMMIDFLSKCLEWDKNKRLSAAKLCKHPWIAGIAKQKI